MRVVLHADASPTMGTGHVMRSLALATALKRQGHEATLAFAEIIEALRTRADALGIPVVERDHAPRDADWIVVDGYHLDAVARADLAELVVPRLVVDDLGTKCGDAAIVLNQNLYATPAGPSHARREGELLAGPSYALLGPELTDVDPERLQPPIADRILVTMGGADPNDATSAVVDALTGLAGTPIVRVLLGAAHPTPGAVQARADASGFEVVRDAPSLAPHLEWSELVVSACGSSVLEVARFGRPLVGVVLADNQQAVASAAQREGLGVVVGRHPTLEGAALARTVDAMRTDASFRALAAKRGPELVDGRGAERVAHILRTGPLALRPATMDDADRLLAWRTDPAARAASFDRRPIERDSHVAWLAERLDSPDSPIWIGLLAEEPVGVVRFALERGIATIGVAMDAHRRAAGLGTRLISLGTARVAADTNVRTVDAWVRRENRASEIAFQRAGYRLERDDLPDRRLYRLSLGPMG